MLGALPEALRLVFLMLICALVGFAGAFWTMSAWFERRLSGREALLLLFGLLALMFFSISLVFRGGPGAVIMVLVMSGLFILGYSISRRASRRLGDALDREDIAKYRSALDFDPKNVAAHSLLGDTYRRMGELGLAVEEYQAALRLDPSLGEERYWLERLETEIERRSRKEMTCPRCGCERPEGASDCPECGRLYGPLETWAHAFRVMDSTRKAAWVGVGAGALTTALAVIALAPGALKLAALLLIFLAPIAAIIMSAWARRRSR